MPPFLLLGLVGPAIALHNNETLAAAFPDRFYVSPGLQRLVEAGRSSIYRYDGGAPQVDEEVRALMPAPADPVVLPVEEIRERVLSVIADEARRMLDEGVVREPMDLDLAMITGAGFQFWNGGILPLLDRDRHQREGHRPPLPPRRRRERPDHGLRHPTGAARHAVTSGANVSRAARGSSPTG